ncbi:MAG: hypothetical protein R2792_18820 [Saprospiraceae bacterium]
MSYPKHGTLFFAIGFGLLFATCSTRHPTIVDGLVINSVTKEPIEDVRFTFSEVDYNSYNNVKYHHERSNSNGEFFIEISGKYEIWISDIYHYDYCPFTRFPPIELNQVNNPTIELLPFDGFFKIVVEDTSGIDSSLYVSTFNPNYLISNSYYVGYQLPQYPIALNQGETYTVVSEEPTEEFIQIMWKYNTHPNTPPIGVDSIYLVKGDTTTYYLNY